MRARKISLGQTCERGEKDRVRVKNYQVSPERMRLNVTDSFRGGGVRQVRRGGASGGKNWLMKK